MNALGLLILGSIAHATGFAVMGSIFYLVWRRWSPAAGAVAAGSSLLIMTLVSMIELGPWPRFQSELHRAAGGSARSHRGLPEWVVLGVCSCLGLGATRLMLGIWSMQQLRARSRPIEDPDLLDAVEILRAELSCSRNIEIRETSALATPATIGWRRPLVLLPGDWRDWNEGERRAVLAHELAHVCRGDFVMGLAAHISLTLHFYNPLAHWLAARLRLEQELAADAWGARLAGGKAPYLTTLAQMALRRDSRALTWPARAFLPSRGTFVRRIEMVRNSTQIRHAPLPTMARLLTVGALSVLGLLVAGLRGPAGLSTAHAQPQGTAADAAKVPAHESYNLTFLPPDAQMVVAVRPQSLLRRRESRGSSTRSSKVWPSKVLAVPIEDVEQLLLFWEGMPTPAETGRTSMVPFPSGAVLRTSKPQEWKALLKNQHTGPMREVRHDGQTYQNIGGFDAQEWGAYAPDDRTLVCAREDPLRELSPGIPQL